MLKNNFQKKLSFQFLPETYRNFNSTAKAVKRGGEKNMYIIEDEKAD